MPRLVALIYTNIGSLGSILVVFLGGGLERLIAILLGLISLCVTTLADDTTLLGPQYLQVLSGLIGDVNTDGS